MPGLNVFKTGYFHYVILLFGLLELLELNPMNSMDPMNSKKHKNLGYLGYRVASCGLRVTGLEFNVAPKTWTLEQSLKLRVAGIPVPEKSQFSG